MVDASLILLQTMDPLQQFLDFINQLKATANATLKGRPPLEQFEASSELSYCFRSLTAQANNLIEFADNSTKKLTSMVESIKTGAAAETKLQLVKDGEFISKADHEAAVTAGKLAAEKDARAAFDAEVKVKDTVAQRRKKLIDDKVLPAVAAERLSDTVLSGEDFMAKAAAVAGRLKKFTDLGITAEKAPTLIGDVAAIPLDAAGDETMTMRLKICQEAGATASRTPAAGAGGGNPLAGAAAAATAEAATDESKAKIRKLI